MSSDRDDLRRVPLRDVLPPRRGVCYCTIVDRTLRESHFRGERSSQRELPTEMVPR